jgi:hypothetical protein
VFEEALTSWHCPVDLGRGGMVLVDGAIVVQHEGDISEGY